MTAATLALLGIVTSSTLAPGLDLGAARRVSVPVRGSIEASLTQAIGEPGAALAAQVARLLRWRGDLIKDVHPGDRVSLLFEDGEEPQLLALEFAGSTFSLRAFRREDADGTPRYYDADGVLVEPGMVNPPVTSYVQITETVQAGRGKRKHQGVDLKAKEGTPVVLPYDAVVSRVNWSTRINGLCVEVLVTGGPARGNHARFLHLLEVDPDVTAGASLPAGSVVGLVGSTGHSTAAHLHYELRAPTGKPLDPLLIHGLETIHIAAGELAAFSHRVAEYLRLLQGAGS